MRKFSEDPKLGVAGTPFTQDGGYDTARDSFEGKTMLPADASFFGDGVLRKSAAMSPME